MWKIEATANMYGQPEADEGWYYGTSFDRLAEAMRTGKAHGITSKTSLVRKRRWIRSMICVSTDLSDLLHQRLITLGNIKRNIETMSRDKDIAVKTIKTYEENRTYVFTQSLHLATKNTLTTLSLLKDLGNKVKLLKQYLLDRMVIEKEHVNKLASITKNYLLASRSPHTNQHIIAGRTMQERATPSIERIVQESPSEDLECSAMFFTNVHAAMINNITCSDDFSSNLHSFISAELDQILVEIQEVLLESRANFRKNSDICRLSEAAVRNFMASLSLAHQSVIADTARQLSDLHEESKALEGLSAYNPQMVNKLKSAAAMMFNSITKGTAVITNNAVDTSAVVSSRSSNSAQSPQVPREDMWLNMQRYKLAVRDSQEALCVLIAESLDLELQQQIFANRVHSMFCNAAQFYSNEETQLNGELQYMWSVFTQNMSASMEQLKLPYPVLKSPFSELDSLLTTSTPPSTALDSTDLDRHHSKDQQVIDFSDSHSDNINHAISLGVFAFTCLFHEPLPKSPGVVRAGSLLCTSYSSFLKAKNPVTDVTWSSVYLVATSDGYVHLLKKRKCDIPSQSFYLKESAINGTSRDWSSEFHRCIFELSISAGTPQRRLKAM